MNHTIEFWANESKVTLSVPSVPGEPCKPVHGGLETARAVCASQNSQQHLEAEAPWEESLGLERGLAWRNGAEPCVSLTRTLMTYPPVWTSESAQWGGWAPLPQLVVKLGRADQAPPLFWRLNVNNCSDSQGPSRFCWPETKFWSLQSLWGWRCSIVVFGEALSSFSACFASSSSFVSKVYFEDGIEY